MVQDQLLDTDRLALPGDLSQFQAQLIHVDHVEGLAGVVGVIDRQAELRQHDRVGFLVVEVVELDPGVEVGTGDGLDLPADPSLQCRTAGHADPAPDAKQAPRQDEDADQGVED